MRFEYKYGSDDGPEIKNFSQWEKAFLEHDSRGELHWKSGKSALSLAKDFMKNGGEETLIKMVEGFTGKQIIGTPRAYIEHPSTFDKYNRARMQDLGVFGEFSDSSTFFIGVEAKVDEPFGSYSIQSQCVAVKKKMDEGISTDAGKRLNELIQDFLDKEQRTLSAEESKIRYQLLYYLAGSFRENADTIFMPVIAYKGESYNEKSDSNRKTYMAFMKTLSFEVTTINGLECYHKVICAPSTKERNTLQSKHVYSCYIVK